VFKSGTEPKIIEYLKHPQSRQGDQRLHEIKFDGYRIQVHPRRQMTTPKKEHNQPLKITRF
jgi:hypothetical protein